MSVINQMLIDLDKRRNVAISSEAVIDGLALPGRVNKRSNNRIFYWIFSLLAVSLLVFILSNLQTSQDFSLIKANSSMENAQLVGNENSSMYDTQQVTSNGITRRPVVDNSMLASSTMRFDTPVTQPDTSARIGDVASNDSAPELALEKADNSRTSLTAIAQVDEEINDKTVDSPRTKKDLKPLTPKQQAFSAYQAGYQRYREGDLSGAIEKLKIALNASPDQYSARELLISLYNQIGDKKSAEFEAKSGVMAQPAHLNFRKIYARMLVDRGDNKSAMALLESRKPSIISDQEYYALLAAIYQRNKLHHRAAVLYRELVKIKPANGLWWMGLGISLEYLGRYSEAKQAYQSAQSSGKLKPSLNQYVRRRLQAI